MFFVSVNGAKCRKKPVIIFIAAVLVVTLAAAFSVALYSKNAEGKATYNLEISESRSVSDFLAQFDLVYAREVSCRSITLPQKEDKIFSEYGEGLRMQGFDILKLSGKEVVELVAELENKDSQGEVLYAVVYIYKEKAVGAHLTTFLQGSDNIMLWTK